MMWIDIDPVAAPRQTRRDKFKPSLAVLRYRAFKDHLRLFVKELPCPLMLIFILPMPESWTDKKKKQMLHMPHTQKPDIDNLQKAVMDAIYQDDAHIHTVMATKVWGKRGSIFIGETNFPYNLTDEMRGRGVPI